MTILEVISATLFFSLIALVLFLGAVVTVQSHLLNKIRKQKMVSTKKGTYTFVPNGVQK